MLSYIDPSSVTILSSMIFCIIPIIVFSILWGVFAKLNKNTPKKVFMILDISFIAIIVLSILVAGLNG